MRNLLRSPVTIALLAGLLCSLVYFAEPLNHVYWNARYKLGGRTASTSAVIVTLDSGASIDGEPGWSTAELSNLLNILHGHVPRRVILDARVRDGENLRGDRSFNEAIARFGPDFALLVRSDSGNIRLPSFTLPNETVVPSTNVIVSRWNLNFYDYAMSSPFHVAIEGKDYQTVGAYLSSERPFSQGSYLGDFSFDADSIPRISIKNVLNGKLSPGLLTGRTVILSEFGSVAQPVGYFGVGRVPDIIVDIAGSEGLKKPISLDLHHSLFRIPMLFVLAALLYVGYRSTENRVKIAAYGFVLISAVVLPSILMSVGVFTSPDVSIVTVVVYASQRAWQKWRRRLQHTSSSGLPNLLALSSSSLDVGRDIVVAIVARYEEILATLPRDLHGECAQQIARRLSVGAGVTEIYHGDGGHFAWTEEARPLDMQLNHLEGLRALFSAPLQIGVHTFDTNIHFGLDRNEGIDPLTRVNSALASANEALTNGRAIELFEAERLADAPWELSLHARIDEGLRNGDIWLAYQLQWDFHANRICGAEALIRWNHPTRGPIAPEAFIVQAERAGRIDSLTYWVLNEAITAAETLNSIGPSFQVSINLSAQMVDKPNLVASFAEIVRARKFDCRRMTIEVTETASVRNRPAATHNLMQLRAMGFGLSIDDFGTGEASLAYLAELPSDELKIDKRFVSRLTSGGREKEIVVHTIALAHALGQRVVAEGIEDEATFQLLKKMGCDHGQGYLLGKPVPFRDFLERYRSGAVGQFGSV